ncbi:MAG: DNA-binding protein [Acholeplasmataceae bacterium]|nr:DNA-binding protein [Acholeplasmataceae bacterium]MDD4194314.1 DNA-binding protein [Acholeplasmataceae bacterium]
METLDKKEYLNQLFDLYEPLLTDKQRLYFEHYYKEDYSLQEISELYQVSRNAIFDHLKKVEEHLSDFEKKLKLLELKNKRLELIKKIEETKDLNLVEELRKLDESW